MKAMQEFVLSDEKSKIVLGSENLSNAKYDFIEEPDFETESTAWVKEMEIDGKGSFKSTASNLNLIFKNDVRLAGIFKLNEFDGNRYVFANLPWRRTNPPEPMRNVDYSGVRNYIESMYGITGNLKIDDVLALRFEEESFHPIRDYIRQLKWDGTKRVDTLFADYFGAPNNSYTKEASRKMLVGALARAFVPGIKFDLVITFVGPEGTGKSTFIGKLGGKWYSDTFTTVHGKESFEQIQGAWIMEIAELSGLRKAEVEAVKHFLTKQVDSFRPAYARVVESFPRQCIFVGTTNSADFLKSTTGNLRFIPIDVRPEAVTKSVWDDLNDDEVGQIWAEAYTMYKKGETLYMSPEADAIAKREQAGHVEQDERTGLVEKYLDTLLPLDWDDMGPIERSIYFDSSSKPKGEVLRGYVCAAQIWCECFGRDIKDMDRYKTREINEIMKTLRGWEPVNSTKNFGYYGKQKYYKRL
jgi:predicted P-loop ATPase